MHCSLEVESSSAYQYVPQSLSTLLIADPFSQQVIHQAPAIFRKTNRNGVPWVSVLAVASVSLLFFGISFLPGGASEIWTWAQNLVGVSSKSLPPYPLMRLIFLDSSTGLESNRLVMYRYRLYSIPSSLEETREINRRVEVQKSCG